MTTTVPSLIPHVVMSPKVEASATVIWLHGLGADGYDFQPIVPHLGLAADLGVRFIFPHAPEQSVTINAGMRMRAWYDILDMTFERKVDEQGILDSVALINALIEHEVATGIAPERIVLAGFSQGGVIALQTALTSPYKLAGILALSTYVTMASQLKPSALDIPIFWGHGSMDPVVPYRLGEQGRDVLTALGLSVEWHSYPMQHNVIDQEIKDIGQWLTRLLG